MISALRDLARGGAQQPLKFLKIARARGNMGYRAARFEESGKPRSAHLQEGRVFQGL
ncbi:MAG: hypothetical protein CM15mP46_4500 [Alphaproteobacteria bacterium]|nr:MAG: hypothetical protein CM15mP46_4500 [Alphaproteobacteria bacterium]